MAARFPVCLLRRTTRKAYPIAAPTWTTPRHVFVFRALSTEPPPPPLLAKLKGDLKTAMKAKDTARLSVLRTILAATLNASKTSSPIKTDVQLVSLLRQALRSSEEAVLGFRTAGRQDLIDSEEAQIRILEEYIARSGVSILRRAELRQVAGPVIEAVLMQGVEEKGLQGQVMKTLLTKDSPLSGKQFEKAELVQVVKALLHERPGQA